MKKVKLIEGGVAVDDRGSVSFINDVPLAKVKRFYIVKNFAQDTIRAWHGHLRESKLVCVVTGSALVLAVPLDDPKQPSRKQVPQRFVLSQLKPTLLLIPAGYANGFRVLEPGTSLMYFSTATLGESKTDDYRLPWDYWGTEVWQVTNR
jgi:dTDP-4-dehydrorhamnose 3,5-epimerase